MLTLSLDSGDVLVHHEAITGQLNVGSPSHHVCQYLYGITWYNKYNNVDNLGYLHDFGNLQLDLNPYQQILFTVTRRKQGKITVIRIVM